MKLLGTQVLETERLILRRYEMHDIPQVYYGWGTDPESSKYLWWDVHKNIDETTFLVTEWIAGYEHNSFSWVVELKDTHKIIGGISGFNIDERNSICEVGYCYTSKYWGHGYATEALKVVIDYLLNQCEIHTIVANHITLNVASGKVMQKAGMKKEAVLKERHYNKNTKQFDDVVCYYIQKHMNTKE